MIWQLRLGPWKFQRRSGWEGRLQSSLLYGRKIIYNGKHCDLASTVMELLEFLSKDISFVKEVNRNVLYHSPQKSAASLPINGSSPLDQINFADLVPMMGAREAALPAYTQLPLSDKFARLS